MIPALILYILKRFRASERSNKTKENIKKIVIKLKAVFFLIVIVSSFAFTNKRSHNTLTYHVVKNDKVIGSIEIEKNRYADSTIYELKSHIASKLLFKFSVTGKEKSIFNSGVLVYSSVFRKLNNKTKVNHEIEFKNGKYCTRAKGLSITPSIGLIKQNLITLYFNEPIGVASVFCDNLAKMVSVTPLAPSKYRVDFENGKYNVFHYKNGKCIKVDAVGKLFKVTLILV